MIRGILIVFEGIDKCGKSTQVKLLNEKLVNCTMDTEVFKFPDRTTSTGKLINEYLTNKIDMEDHVIHLLFSANRWEKEKEIIDKLTAGINIIIDRYAYSGIAYSATKANLNFEWCKYTDIGLPKPDIVFYLKPNSVNEVKSRENFGEERYEKCEIQMNANENFNKLMKENSNWISIDASLSITEIHTIIMKQVFEVFNNLKRKEISKLW